MKILLSYIIGVFWIFDLSFGQTTEYSSVTGFTKTCKMSEIQLETNGIYITLVDKKPFTGRAIENFNDSIRKKEIICKNGRALAMLEYYATKKKKSEKFFSDTIPVGAEKYWYENGFLKKQILFEKGMPVNALEWYPNGQKKSELLYKEGKPEGKYHEWHDNGVLQTEGQYMDGKKIGVWKKYFPDGKLEKVRHFLQ